MSGTMTLRRSVNALNKLQGESKDQGLVFPRTQPPPRLLDFEELPQWYKDNPFVRRGYRAVSQSVWACFDSWTYLHNESVNIYSHLVPAVGMLVAQSVLQRQISVDAPEASLMDRAVFSCNLLAATITLLLSTTYHTLMNHSPYLSLFCLRVDYVGIVILILGSFISGIYVGFYCEPGLQKLHWASIVTLSVVTSILVLHPRLQGLKYRSYRTTAFIATGLSGFAPITHGLLKYGWAEMWERSGMPYYLLEGLVYGIGAFFFATRIPESIWPGRFDVWGSSHQLFHMLVVLASAVHIFGVWQAFTWHYEHNRSCGIR